MNFSIFGDSREGDRLWIRRAEMNFEKTKAMCS